MNKEDSPKDLTGLDNGFYRNRGKALNLALAVENNLEFFIYQYFVRPQNSKTFFFDRLIVQPLSFTQKINVFKEICKREEFDKRKVKEICKLLNEIRETRNKIAHWETIADPKKMEISLMKRADFISVNNHLKIDDKMIQDFDDKRLNAIEGITDFYLQYSKEGTLDERWERKMTKEYSFQFDMNGSGGLIKNFNEIITSPFFTWEDVKKLKNVGGVYFIYYNEEVVYIGSTKDFSTRFGFDMKHPTTHTLFKKLLKESSKEEVNEIFREKFKYRILKCDDMLKAEALEHFSIWTLEPKYNKHIY